jgi:hypothetical protein
MNLGESDFFSEAFMNFRSIHGTVFHGFFYWRDTEGAFFRVDLIDDSTGQIILPRIGTCLVWGENLLLGAAGAFLEGRALYHPYGTQPGDEQLIPWNRWMPLTEAEKLARYTPL